MCHSDETGWVQVDDLTKVSELRADSHSLVWGEVDVTDFTEEDFATIVEEFELDRMAVEDARALRQRPKIEHYEGHKFAVLHELYEVDEQLEKRQVSCFVGEDFVLVFHEAANELLARVRERLTTTQEDTRGPIYLLYALLDTIVDEHQELADELEERIEAIEESVVATAQRRVREPRATYTKRQEDQRTQLDLYSIKQQVARLRRYALPAQRVAEWFVHHPDSTIIPAAAFKLFRDVYDHTLRIAEQVHNVDALAQAVLDLTRAEQSEDLNEINKKLTAWAAIFAVATVIGGIYGMNFELVPATGSLLGFWFALGLMVVGCVGLFFYFLDKGWL
jgi:magnesium transporter